jgi:23S rRNA pseudouridine1911/1915/1917 synthase
LPYIKKEYKTIRNIKIEEFLLNHINITSLNEKLLISLLKKGKIYDENNKRYQQDQIIKSDFVYVTLFEARTKNLKPTFQNRYFAIFDKPSGLLVHPTSSSDCSYTLLDEIKFHLGDDASLIHRIDKETSGLVLVAIDKYSEFILKSLFVEKTLNDSSKIKKSYLALVNGKVSKDHIIDEAISSSKGLIKLKMEVNSDGKSSKTIIEPLKYDSIKNQSLIKAIPITGRQHQIRVHCDYIGHSIIGDPIYGISDSLANDILNKKVKKTQRLMLQAHTLEFEFLGNQYKFKSLLDFFRIKNSPNS